jgi:hypothetical protein
MLYFSPQASPGISYNSRYRWILVSTSVDTYPLDVTAEYVAKFGTLVAGKKIFLKVVQSQAGMQDSGTVFTAIVGA